MKKTQKFGVLPLLSSYFQTSFLNFKNLPVRKNFTVTLKKVFQPALKAIKNCRTTVNLKLCSVVHDLHSTHLSLGEIQQAL